MLVREGDVIRDLETGVTFEWKDGELIFKNKNYTESRVGIEAWVRWNELNEKVKQDEIFQKGVL